MCLGWAALAKALLGPIDAGLAVARAVAAAQDNVQSARTAQSRKGLRGRRSHLLPVSSAPPTPRTKGVFLPLSRPHQSLPKRAHALSIAFRSLGIRWCVVTPDTGPPV